ncbi:MAG: DUF2249 domain-containing protein [Chloroflexota bacterium]
MADTVTQATKVGEAIHNHHQEILDTLSGHVASIVGGDIKADPAALVEFLKGDLLPHARGEEEHLYPAVDPLVKLHGKPTATMMIDHEYISRYVSQIEEATNLLRVANTEEEPARRATLQRLSLQLEAVLALHLEKEERVYIPLFEKYLAEEEQQDILNGMHEAYEPDAAAIASAPVPTLDVREIAPRQRHEMIFARFNALKPGDLFILANDHDPKPLYYQFKAEHDGQFSWDYLQQGPETWLVRIARI